MSLVKFQLSVLALILFSLLMVIAVPVIFASANGWEKNKNFLFVSSFIWIALVFTVAVLNSFII